MFYLGYINFSRNIIIRQAHSVVTQTYRVKANKNDWPLWDFLSVNYQLVDDSSHKPEKLSWKVNSVRMAQLI